MESSAEQVSKLTWTHSLARSGRLKHITPVSKDLAIQARKQSRRHYNVRFRQDVAEKSRKRQGTADLASRAMETTRGPATPDSNAPNAEVFPETTIATPPPSLPFASPTHEVARLLWSMEPRHRVEAASEDVLHSTGTGALNGATEDLIEDALLLDAFAGATPTASEELLLEFQDDVFPRLARTLSPIPTLGNDHFMADRRFFLQYYIERVIVRLMPLWNAPDNPFISIIVPASFDSPILTHAIMALAIYHHSLTSTAPQHSQGSVKAFWHHQQVLDLLQKNLQRPDVLRDDSTLGACMLMQTFQVLCSGTSGWDHWLRGATLFVQMRGRLEHDLKGSNIWMRLAKCVVAVETFAATSAEFELTVSGDYWNIYRRLREDELKKIAQGVRGEDFIEDAHFEKLVGCSAVVVYALGRMQMLIDSRTETEKLGHDDVRWREAWTLEASRLEDLLLRWRSRTSDPDKLHLSEAFRHAALIFHARSLRRMPYNSMVVQFRVQATFDHLLSLTAASKLEGIALYPTLMAALEIDEEHNEGLQVAALNRIRVMKTAQLDPLYDNAEKLLHLVWSKRRFAATEEEKCAIDWRDVSRTMGWKWCMV